MLGIIQKGIYENKKQMDRQIEKTREQLKLEVEGLIRNLENTLDELKENKNPNQFGVIQLSGPMIDRLCGELSALNQAKKTFEETVLGINQ